MVGSNHFTCVWLEVTTNPLEQVLWVMGSRRSSTWERENKRERENRRFARRWQNRVDARGEAPIHYGVALLATHLPLPLQ